MTAFKLRPYRAEDEDAAIALWLRTWQQTYPDIDFAARVAWWRERWRGELVPNAAIVVARIVIRRRAVALPPVDRALPRAVFVLAIAVGVALVTGRLVVLLHATDIGDMIVGPIAGLLAGTIVASIIVRRRAEIWRAAR